MEMNPNQVRARNVKNYWDDGIRERRELPVLHHQSVSAFANQGDLKSIPISRARRERDLFIPPSEYSRPKKSRRRVKVKKHKRVWRGSEEKRLFNTRKQYQKAITMEDCELSISKMEAKIRKIDKQMRQLKKDYETAELLDNIERNNFIIDTNFKFKWPEEAHSLIQALEMTLGIKRISSLVGKIGGGTKLHRLVIWYVDTPEGKGICQVFTICGSQKWNSESGASSLQVFPEIEDSKITCKKCLSL